MDIYLEQSDTQAETLLHLSSFVHFGSVQTLLLRLHGESSDRPDVGQRFVAHSRRLGYLFTSRQSHNM